MAQREKFGRLILLDQTDSDPLGDEYRAARLGPAGFDRLVSVLRFSAAVSGHAEASRRLVDEARQHAQFQNPSLVRVLGVGRVQDRFYVSTDLIEGRSLREVLRLCSDEGFPFAVDHALMIASRAAAGLEALHRRKGEGGRPLVHGMLTPGRLMVAFDGEVKVKGLGLWPALGAADLLAPEERRYFAPEQARGVAEPRSDVYALGLALLEALCGQAPDGRDPLERIAAVRIASPGGDPGPLPKPLANLLRGSLGPEPSTRFANIAEMRRAIDAMLFSGDFTPTTFDLAFFMHTLFRDQVERDARALEQARAADYREFLVDESGKVNAPAARKELEAPVSSAARDAGPPTVVPPLTLADAARPPDVAATPAARTAGPDSSAARLARLTREPAPRPAPPPVAPREPGRRSLALVLGLVAAVAAATAAGWFYFLAQQRGAASAAARAEQQAAEGRVRELETRIAQLEREKTEAESRAADEARLAFESQAAQGERAVDPAAVARAQQEARRRTSVEQERKQRDELARLSEAKRVEQQRPATAAQATLGSETRAVEPVSGPAAEPMPGTQLPATTATETPIRAPTPEPRSTSDGPTPNPTAGGSAAPADPSDPAVRPPGLISEDPIPYPERSASRRIAAVVVVRALVDETGRVSEAAIVQASGQPLEYGFDQAALSRVKSRRYRPARRNDLPVPIWVVVRVEFRPPPLR